MRRKTSKSIIFLGLLLICLGVIVIARATYEEPEPLIDAGAGGESPLLAQTQPTDPMPEVPGFSGDDAQQEAPADEITEPVEETPEPLPTPPDIDITQWQYVCANVDRLLPSDYAPELTELEGGQYFDSRAVDALKEFIAAARSEGLTVILSSSYRSYSTQQYLFNNKVAQTGSEEAAAKIVAIPGSSEHQLGLSADIVDGYYQYMNESLAETELLKWMYAHCQEYGFILRYPEDKQDITKIMFEPWHFRYVGEEAASYIMENGLCLEEFVALYE